MVGLVNIVLKWDHRGIVRNGVKPENCQAWQFHAAARRSTEDSSAVSRCKQTGAWTRRFARSSFLFGCSTFYSSTIYLLKNRHLIQVLNECQGLLTTASPGLRLRAGISSSSQYTALHLGSNSGLSDSQKWNYEGRPPWNYDRECMTSGTVTCAADTHSCFIP